MIIGEELQEKKKSIKDVVGEITDIICKRAALKKNYGTILIPEGSIEFFPEFNVLISEINEIYAENKGAENLKEIVIDKLTEDSKKSFIFLPSSI